MLMTAGPWRPIYLEVYKSRIDDLHFTTKVADSLETAEIAATADLEGALFGSSVTFELSLNGSVVDIQTAKVVESRAQMTFDLHKPELWYPANYGKQPLYQLRATLHLDDIELDSVAKKLGIRKALVVQRELKDAPGTSFFFEINNIPIFCGGSNWIPADNFIPRISKDRYRSWLKLVLDGNQVMVR
jgi:beta-mannosidase